MTIFNPATIVATDGTTENTPPEGAPDRIIVYLALGQTATLDDATVLNGPAVVVELPATATVSFDPVSAPPPLPPVPPLSPSVLAAANRWFYGRPTFAEAVKLATFLETI